MFKFLFYLYLHLYLCETLASRNSYIENFAQADISKWIEHSDTVENEGTSKASLVLLKTSMFQRAVLFTLLHPLPCGAAFAGVRKYLKLDLTPYKDIILKVRGEGSFNGYKLVLKERNQNHSFCNFFEVSKNFKEINLPIKDFKPYYEGKLLTEPNIYLNLSKIASIDIQAYGGAHLPIKQSGVGSLEIDWIKYE